MLSSIYNTFISSAKEEEKNIGFYQTKVIYDLLVSNRPVCLNFSNDEFGLALSDVRKVSLDSKSTILDGHAYLDKIQRKIIDLCLNNSAGALSIVYGKSPESIFVTFKDGKDKELRVQGLSNELPVAIWNLAVLYFKSAYEKQPGRMDISEISNAIDLFDWHHNTANLLTYGSALPIYSGAIFNNAAHSKILSSICTAIWHHEKMLQEHEIDPIKNELEPLAYWSMIHTEDARDQCFRDTLGILDVVNKMLTQAIRWWTIIKLAEICDPTNMAQSQVAVYHIDRIVKETEAEGVPDAFLMKKTLARAKRYAKVDTWISVPYLSPPQMPDICKAENINKDIVQRTSMIQPMKIQEK